MFLTTLHCLIVLFNPHLHYLFENFGFAIIIAASQWRYEKEDTVSTLHTFLAQDGGLIKFTYRRKDDNLNYCKGYLGIGAKQERQVM